MTTDDLRRDRNAEPFRPFRIHMASGRTFDIRHPEMLWIGGASAIIFTFVSESSDIYDDWHTVGLRLIESISFLDAQQPSASEVSQ